MPKLITIRGNSGSGKTSVAKALQKKLGRNTLIIAQDNVRREMLWANDGNDTTALPLMLNLLHYGYEHCEYIIIEGILKSDWYMPLFEAAKEKFKDCIYAYYYDISFEETLKRHQTKDKRFEFGEPEMRRWWNEKDYIKIISEKSFTEDISLEDAINVIYSDILEGIGLK